MTAAVSDPDPGSAHRPVRPVASELVVFEYLYRDAGNYKAFGRVLVRGRFTSESEAVIRAVVGADGFFVAEQIGVPPVYAELWALSSGPCSDDHVFHEFLRLRRPEEEDLRLPIWGDLDVLVHRLREACRAPDLAASPHLSNT